MDISKQLEKETHKWLVELEKDIKHIEASELSEPARNEFVNIKAYISDCRYFLKKKDFIRAFEAVIYAWGICDTLTRMKLTESEKPRN